MEDTFLSEKARINPYFFAQSKSTKKFQRSPKLKPHSTNSNQHYPKLTNHWGSLAMKQLFHTQSKLVLAAI